VVFLFLHSITQLYDNH